MIAARREEIRRLASDKLFLPDGLDLGNRLAVNAYMGHMPDYEGYLRLREVTQRKRTTDSPPAWMLPAYVEPLLTREQEEHQFRKYNIVKAQCVRYLDRGEATAKVEVKWTQALGLQERVSLANFRLIVSYLRKKGIPAHVMEDLISECYFKSMRRAVECFDWRKGNKFSTYLSWALFNNVPRHLGEEYQLQTRFKPSGLDIHKETPCDDLGYFDERRWDRAKDLLEKLLPYAGTNGTTQRSIYVLVHRFGLRGHESRTLEEVGKSIGVSKERVRQIQDKAIRTIRDHVQEHQIPLELDI